MYLMYTLSLSRPGRVDMDQPACTNRSQALSWASQKDLSHDPAHHQPAAPTLGPPLRPRAVRPCPARPVRAGAGARDAGTPRRARRHRSKRRAADLRQHGRRIRSQRPASCPRAGAVQQSLRVRDIPRAAGRATARSRAGCRARKRRLHAHAALLPRAGVVRKAPPALAHARAIAVAGANSARFRPRRRAAVRCGAKPLRALDAATGRAHDGFRAERAARRVDLEAGVARRRRPRRTARFRPQRRTRSRRRAWTGRCARRHAVALLDRSVPHVLRAARLARAGLARLGHARRACG
jgi:hypothetical protein